MSRASLPFLLVTAFLFAVGMSIVFPLLPALVGQYVSGREQATVVGLLAALYAFLAFFSGPVLGAVSDAYGRRPVLLLSLVGTATGNLLFGLGGSLGLLFLGRFLEGVTSGGMGALMAYVADTTDEADRGAVFARIGATVGAGMILGPAIGGALAHFGLGVPMFAAAAIALLNALWGAFALPESLPPRERHLEFSAGHLNPFAHLRAALAHPPVRRLVTVSMLFTLPLPLLQIALPILAQGSLHWSVAQVGTLFMVAGTCDIVGQGLVLPRLLTRFGERRVALSGLVMGAAGLLLLAGLSAWPSAGLLYGAVVVFSLGEGTFTAAFNTLLSLAIPAGEQGRVQGGAQALGELTQVVGPLAGGGLYARFGGAGTFSAGAGLAVLALVLLAGRTTPAASRVAPGPGLS